MLLKEKDAKKLDPRIKRTRQMLQQALTTLMAEKSFQAISIQDIAERATVNRATFYAHFEDKEALLEYVIRESFKHQLNNRLSADAPFSSENLSWLILTVCDFLTEMKHHCPPPHTLFDPLMEKQIKAQLYELLLNWLHEVPFGKSKPFLELTAMMSSWAIYGAVMQWSQQPQPQPAQEFVQQVLPIILSNLSFSAKTVFSE